MFNPRLLSALSSFKMSSLLPVLKSWLSFLFQECLINTFAGTCPCFPPLLPCSLEGPFTTISPPSVTRGRSLCHVRASCWCCAISEQGKAATFELSGCFISSALPGVLQALSVLPHVFDLVRFPAIYISSHISSSYHLLPYVLLISEM